MNRAVLILGMHRSGTSSLTGILEKAGLYLGNVSKENAHNPKGNQENPRIMRLHESLFLNSGGTWDNPPETILWSDEPKKERDDILREYLHAPLWGFKDPRTVLVLNGWLEVLSNVSFVGTFRHPVSVALSLARRNGFSFTKSFRLWKFYNEKLLQYHEQYGFPMVSFDLPLDAYEEKVKRLCLMLELAIQNKAFEFFDNSLRHTVDVSDDHVPKDVLALYRKMEESAL